MEREFTMTTQIRMLNAEDIPLLQAMDTGIEGDYILRIAGNLMEGNNRLFGLFIDNSLVSFGCYSIFDIHYSMHVHSRSDYRFMTNRSATESMSHIRNAAFRIPHIQWAGANTQEYNLSARRVLGQIKFRPWTRINGALTDDVS